MRDTHTHTHTHTQTDKKTDLHEQVVAYLELNGSYDEVSFGGQNGEFPLAHQVGVDTGVGMGGGRGSGRTFRKKRNE